MPVSPERQLLNDIRQTLDTFHPGRLVEIRAIGLPQNGRRVTASGYFDDPVTCATEVAKLDVQKAEGIYFILNEIHAGLIARSPNRFQISPPRTTSDRDIVRLRWALVDIDPIRPAGISATEREIKAALQIRDELLDWFGDYRPDILVKGFSGNGYHLLTPIEEETEAVPLDDAMRFLSEEFSSDLVKVDVSVTKRAQLTKLYGTHARKGYEIANRIHRRSFLES